MNAWPFRYFNTSPGTIRSRVRYLRYTSTEAETSRKYSYRSEPFAFEEKDDVIVVTSRLVGDFPGSPVDLRFFFGLEGNKISSLEIKV